MAYHNFYFIMSMEVPSRPKIERPEDVEQKLEEGLQRLAEQNNMTKEQLNGLMSVRSSQPAYEHVGNPFYKGPPVPIEDSRVGRFIEQHHTIKGTVGEDGTPIMIDRQYRGPEPTMLAKTVNPGSVYNNPKPYTIQDFTSYKATIEGTDMDPWKDAPGLYEQFANIVQQRDALMSEARSVKEEIIAFATAQEEEQKRTAEVEQPRATRDALMAKVLGRKEN